MMFMQLPIEIVDNIILYTLPEGFEGMALTCKRIYGQCITFLAGYNELRKDFYEFDYYMRRREPSFTSASDILLRIAAEPVVARYVRRANFTNDRTFILRQVLKFVPSIQDGGALVELFANSVYLKEAHLDWKEYYATFESDVIKRRYSQHGAAFLLTLLPNIKKLTIPRNWKPNDVTDKLLDAVVNRAARESISTSLASLTRFEGSVSLNAEDRFDLRWANPFLALPRMRSFCGPSCVGWKDIPASLAFRDSHRIAATLQAAHLNFCCIDAVGIADFLRHTPSLETLRYLHCTKTASPSKDWDICKFVNAVEREAGSRLVQFSVVIKCLQGALLPGKASIRRFQRLQMLEIPLELVMCNIAAAAEHIASPSNPFLDLLPISVAKLAIRSKGTDHHDEALDALLRHLQSDDDSQLPALQEMHIWRVYDSDDVYKDQCDRVVKEATDKGVDVTVHQFINDASFLWDGQPA